MTRTRARILVVTAAGFLALAGGLGIVFVRGTAPQKSVVVLSEAAPPEVHAPAAPPLKGGPAPTPSAADGNAEDLGREWRVYGETPRRPRGRPLAPRDRFPSRASESAEVVDLRRRFHERRSAAVREQDALGKAHASGEYAILRGPEGTVAVALKEEDAPLFRAMDDARERETISDLVAVPQTVGFEEGGLQPHTFVQDLNPALRAMIERLDALKQEVVERHRREGLLTDPEYVLKNETDGRLVVLRRGAYPALDALKADLARASGGPR